MTQKMVEGKNIHSPTLEKNGKQLRTWNLHSRILTDMIIGRELGHGKDSKLQVKLREIGKKAVKIEETVGTGGWGSSLFGAACMAQDFVLDKEIVQELAKKALMSFGYTHDKSRVYIAWRFGLKEELSKYWAKADFGVKDYMVKTYGIGTMHEHQSYDIWGDLE